MPPDSEAAVPPNSEAAWAPPPLFLYGLLRPGERYWPDLEATVRERCPARVRGRLSMHASGHYPMLEVGGDDWVYGDLAYVDDAAAVHRLVFMELSAGYEARWIEAYPTPGQDEDRSVAAVAFCWPWGATYRGAAIMGGDWSRR